MPRKKASEDQADQSKRFVEHAIRMIDDGSLSPTEAAAVMERTLARGAKLRNPTSSEG